jgi:hypothetical protein
MWDYWLETCRLEDGHKNCCSHHSSARSLNLKEAATPPLIRTQRLWQFQRTSPTDVTVGTALRCKEARVRNTDGPRSEA